jgi:hypothetical protein
MKPNAPWEGSSLGRLVAAVLAAATIASGPIAAGLCSGSPGSWSR